MDIKELRRLTWSVLLGGRIAPVDSWELKSAEILDPEEFPDDAEGVLRLRVTLGDYRDPDIRRIALITFQEEHEDPESAGGSQATS